jgi:hypothetical protein
MEIVMMRSSMMVAGVIALGFAPSSALAASRTFVSGAGSDSGSCVLTAPCRTFAYAITQTSAGGEITILSSAGYGPATITQSITISNPGGFEAAITVNSGQNGVTITATSTASITLRGLTLLGGGVGSNGVVLNSGVGGSINIIDCIVKDFVANGIAIQPSGGTLTALISDTYALNNGSGGINIAPTSSGIVKFSIAQVTAKDNANGIYLDASASTGKVSGVISGSHADYNSGNGITAVGMPGFLNVWVHIKDSYATGNTVDGISGVFTGSAAFAFSGNGIVLNNVYAISNGTDLAASSSEIFTFGNNFWGSSSGNGAGTASLR